MFFYVNEVTYGTPVCLEGHSVPPQTSEERRGLEVALPIANDLINCACVMWPP